MGGTKTHALLTDQNGQVSAFTYAGPGNWESVGYAGLTAVLQELTNRILKKTDIDLDQIAGVGMGIAGFDWPSQKQAHLDAIAPLGFNCPLSIVNDSILGIIAGTQQGWGISVVSGTGCNCRGLGRDRQKEGRVVGGAGQWSGEAAGGFDILSRAMRAVTFEWNMRGPATSLSCAFLKYTGARNLDELIEGVYLNRYILDPNMVMLVFETARRGDPQAVAVMQWAGKELGELANGVIKQLEIQDENFEVVLIGKIFEGHPLITKSMQRTIHQSAPRSQLVRLLIPPVVGAVLLGMEAAGVASRDRKDLLIRKGEQIINDGN